MAGPAIPLPYTLQTWLGMVTSNGEPASRNYPPTIVMEKHTRTSFARLFPLKLSFSGFLKHQFSDRIAGRAIQFLTGEEDFDTVPSADYPRGDTFKKFGANLNALKADVGKEQLRTWIRTRTRFDLEQAAAVVVSAFMQEGRVDDAVRLVKELGPLLAGSCMWVDPNIALPMSKGPSVTLPNLARKLQGAVAKQSVAIPIASSYEELVPLLMRVRRRRKDNNQCFNIPQWIWDEARMDPPAHFKACFEFPDMQPTSPKADDSIVISRKHFRHIQRRIYRLFRFWKPDLRLRRNIKKLEDQVLYAGSWIEERVFNTDDIALLCHYFFYFQRRFQKKVVSNEKWTSFLGKGEGNKVFQNNVRHKSTFENALLDIVESNEEGVIVAMGDESTLALIDETCLLMKEYVDLYGGGKTENLTFKKGGAGGTGRGPVDDYNLLCDVLSDLRAQARDQGIADVPGMTKKFLAKDIMHWNNAWADDAFAGEERPGWEEWIDKRKLLGATTTMVLL
ncbi:hypothetical protein P154DRAFT_521242 [Amniculicola lignicola CBS 123094]|uniref:Uncharacterized protein n=1 Tax=Amniculicola lignicola CBS 123094 TaxID=1392246 RepID=A0A6A5WMI3_9PLEO|nr:hypothetical protein P154DRAFT_521242 [Amniculicola lignicola CBS 123094]